MKKYVTLLTISLICHYSLAEVTPQDFQTVNELIANVKKENPRDILYDTNGIIVGVELPHSSDRKLHLLSDIKSIRYLQFSGGPVSTNGIAALTEFPHLTGLRIICGAGPKKDVVPTLPCLTNLQFLELVETYWTNDALYLAKMTNLVALHIVGDFPRAHAELLFLTNLVNLRELVIASLDEQVSNLDTNIIFRFPKLTNFVVSSDLDLVSESMIWKMPFAQ